MSSRRSTITLSFMLLLALLSGCSAPQISLPPTPAVPTVTAGNPTTAPTRESQPTTLPSPTLEATETLIPTVTPPSVTYVAFIGADGNIWLGNPEDTHAFQITQDAAFPQPGGASTEQQISYESPAWSSNGTMLAYTRVAGTPVETGLQYQFSLWTYDLAQKTARQVIENEQITGFAWQPGTRRLTYGRMIPFEYFSKGDKSGVMGLWSLDTDTGQSSELVTPKNGRPLVNPRWSPDGRFVGFEEVMGMEGRGNFSYFDLAKQETIAWEEIIGGYSWSPDGEWIVYDSQAYSPTGDERIWRQPRTGGQEEPLSPDFRPGYAFGPQYSPQGDQVAYLGVLSDPNQEDNPSYNLFVAPIPGGSEPRPLATFTQVFGMSWSPDGRELVISAGPYETAMVNIVRVADGSILPLAPGKFPAWQPAN